jgi:hypothetical protein
LVATRRRLRRLRAGERAGRLDGGAGTTTATVLTRAIFSEGCKAVAAGMNPMDLKRGIEKAVTAVVDDLKAKTKMISTTEEIAQVRSRWRDAPRTTRWRTCQLPKPADASWCTPFEYCPGYMLPAASADILRSDSRSLSLC